MFAAMSPTMIAGYAAVLFFVVTLIVSRTIHNAALKKIEDAEKKSAVSSAYERTRMVQTVGFFLIALVYFGLLVSPLTNALATGVYALLILGYGIFIVLNYLKTTRSYEAPKTYRSLSIVSIVVFFLGYSAIFTALAFGLYIRFLPRI